jgi:CRP-like cAMP-binding protein
MGGFQGRPMKKTNGARGDMPGQIDCESCPLRRFTHFREFTPAELEFVKTFKIGELCVDAGAGIIAEGTNSAHLYTVLEGWTFRYKTLESGNRQILNFALPGDFIGLQSSMFNEMDHSVDALSEVRLCVFARDRIWELFERHAGLAFDLTWLATHDERLLGAYLTAVGQRSAAGRIAFVLLHLYQRCEPIELAGADRLPVPFSQQHLADLLGLSLVHTNKTLKRMESAGLLEWRKGVIRLMDRERLAELAEFDAASWQGRPFI